MPDQDDRERIRNEDDCEKEFQPSLEDLCLPQDSPRRPAPCDPPEDECLDDYSTPQAEIPDSDPDTDTPDPIIVGNVEVSVSCLPELSDTQDVYPGDVEDLFYWETIPGISPDQLSHINSLGQATRNSVMGASITTIEDTLNLTTEQATYFDQEFEKAVVEAAARGGYGTPAVVYADTFQDNVDWRTIPRITDSKLDYISKLDPGVQASVSGMDVDGIKSVFKLTDLQANHLRDEIDDKSSDLNDVAVNQASLLVRCYWKNNEVELTCPDDPLTDTEGQSLSPAANTHVLIPAGATDPVTGDPLYISFNSQAEADSLAETQAVSDLVCWYAPPEITVKCTDPELGYTDEVPGTITVGDVSDSNPPDPTLTGSAGIPVTRVGAVVVSSRNPRFASRFNVEDAEAVARAYAVSLLECRYFNDEQTGECPPGAGDVGGSVTITVSPGTGPVDQNGNPVSFGQQVTVEASYVVSESSQADADAAAQALALQLKDCFFTNDEQTRVCTDVKVLGEDLLFPGDTGYDDPQAVLYVPNEEITVRNHGQEAFSNTVLANTTRVYSSDESSSAANTQAKADANTQAETLALATLFCIYCSKPVDPQCVPGTGQTAGSLSLTLGASECLTQGIDPRDIQDQAEALARIPVVADGGNDDLCEYGNDEIRAACVADSVGGVVLNHWIFSDPSTVLSDATSPAPGESITIPANTIVVYGEAVDADAHKANANEQARALATAVMDCFFTNTLIEEACVGSDNDPFETGVDYKLHSSSSSYPSGEPTGVVKIVPETVFSYFDQPSADAQARVMALSILVCLYTNKELIVQCVPLTGVGPVEAVIDYNQDPPSVVSSTVVPVEVTLASGASPVDQNGDPVNRGQIVTVEEGYSPPTNSGIEAVLFAQNMGGALLDCFYANNPAIKQCPTKSLGGETYSPDKARTEASHGPDAYEAIVHANEIKSYVGKSDANAQANTMAEAMLACLYCSKEVYPLCPTQSGVTSLSLTLGAEPCMLVGPEPSILKSEAEAIARIPVVLDGGNDDLCEYGNDEVVAACVEGSADIPEEETQQNHWVFPSTEVGVSDKISPAPGESITIPANTIVVYGEAVDADAHKANANEQARALASAMMDCFFTNEEQNIYCEGAAGGPDPIPTGEKYQLHIESNKYPDTNSPGVITIPVETTFSYVSKEDADAQAVVLAESFQNCLYENLLVTINCADDGDDFGPGLSMDEPNPNGSVMSASTEEGAVVSDLGPQAVQLAKVIAASQLVCLYGNSVSPSISCGSYAATGGGGFNDLSVSSDVVATDGGPVSDATVGVNTIVSPLSVADANERAEILYKSRVTCEYYNSSDVTVNCSDSDVGGDGGTYDGTEIATGAVGSVTINNGDITAASVGGVIELLKTSIRSRLQCLYVTSEDAVGDCPTGESVIHEVTIPAGTLTSSESAEDALAVSQALADAMTICSGSGSSTSTSNPTSGSDTPSTSDPTSGSSKDTAIVPAPWLGPDKYAALFVEEQPEVVFSDHFDARITKRVSRFKLDKRFFDVCAPNTIRIVGLVADMPGVIGAEILEETAEIVIRVGWFSRIKRVTGRVSGVRKGFDGLRLPTKTREDYEANERWIKRE